MNKLILILFSFGFFLYQISQTSGWTAWALAALCSLILMGSNKIISDSVRLSIKHTEGRLRKYRKMIQVLQSLSEISDDELKALLATTRNQEVKRGPEPIRPLIEFHPAPLPPEAMAPSNGSLPSRRIHKLRLVENEDKSEKNP